MMQHARVHTWLHGPVYARMRECMHARACTHDCTCMLARAHARPSRREATNELSGFLGCLREAEFLGIGVDMKELRKHRQHGKRAAGVGYVLEQLSEEKLPEKPQDLGRHAKAIAVKLKQKGIGPSMIELPIHVQKALQTLQDAVVA